MTRDEWSKEGGLGIVAARRGALARVMMLTNVDLSKIPPSDPFYADAAKVNGMIGQVRKLPAHREVR